MGAAVPQWKSRKQARRAMKQLVKMDTETIAAEW
jgi:hypothetical protein